jgi:hypothetical protein
MNSQQFKVFVMNECQHKKLSPIQTENRRAFNQHIIKAVISSRYGRKPFLFFSITQIGDFTQTTTRPNFSLAGVQTLVWQEYSRSPNFSLAPVLIAGVQTLVWQESREFSLAG